MDILDDLYSRAKSVADGLTGGSLIREVIMRYEADVLELQKQQLFEGKASSGEDMRPYYSEDLKPTGYFYTVESAGRYADWKKSLSYPYSAQRNPDAPNLYINGRFHDELGVRFDAEMMAVEGATDYAAGIVAKYGEGQFGLTWLNWNEILITRGAFEGIVDEVKKILYE